MIQLFVRTTDLTPQDPPSLKLKGYFVDPDEQKAWETYVGAKDRFDCIDLFMRDIFENGMKKAIKVDWHGVIHDGDCRYWVARALKWEYVPIDAHYLLNGKGRKRDVKPPMNLNYKGTENKEDFFLANRQS